MRNRFKTIVTVAVVAVLVVAALALTGCGSKGVDLVGEWTIDGSPMTVVFTETDVKFPGGQTYPYTVDEEAMTITITPTGGAASTSPFTLSEDGKKLAITETIEDQEYTTNFTKKSDNGEAEPSVDATGMPSSTDSSTSK